MTAKFTIEVEVEVDYDFRAGREAQTFGPPEHCYPAEADEIEITKIERFAILEPRRDPDGKGSWTKTRWIGSDLLQHILKYMPHEKFAELILENDYARELAEDAIRERESD
jgi:hypothetical protein